MNFHDAETISAYLDGKLSPSEASRLETRLASEADLRLLMEDLRVSRRLLHRTPRRRAPRNFTLRPQMKQLRGPEPRAVPVLRFASILAGLLLVATFALNGLARSGGLSLAAAPVPAYGVGGGAGGVSTEEQPLQSFAAPVAPEASAETPAPQDLGVPTALARAEGAPKQAPPAAGAAPTSQAAMQTRIPALWQLSLAVAVIVCGFLAWSLHQRARRNFYSNWLEK